MASSGYVKVGIDHGTTNSSIAFMDGDQPRVVKPDGVDEVMPSAVYVNRQGRTLVGRPAIEAMARGNPEEGEGHTGYKLRIGQDDRYEFAAARKVMTAPELGSLVIGALLKAYTEETGDRPEACVITVPAKFAQSACEGTREAARLAGLSYYPQLQEPVAAALAYGFSTADKRAHWMVFDLGGGTLDVSIVIVRNGQMVVPEEGHAGDNHLGGRNFDREMFEFVLGRLKKDDKGKKRYALDSFAKANPKYRSAWERLNLAVEEAKITLSEKEFAVVEVAGVLCRDEEGKDVKVEVPVTREQYEHMIGPDIEKAVHLCQNLLRANKLVGKVDKLILVGGPTKTPYVQQVLAERLGIPLDSSIDPMTAVAQGAGLFATTCPVPDAPGTVVAAPVAGTVQLKLEYERQSRTPTYCLVGKVEGASSDGLVVEVQRTDGLWSSGSIPVGQGGVFDVDLLLADKGKPHLSRFKTTLRDGSGHTLASLEEPEIYYPFPEGHARLANSLRVAVKGNQTEVLVKQGADLPARGRHTFVTTKDLKKGSPEDVLSIAVLEGVTHLFGSEDSRADTNLHVGSLVIRGSDERITMDVPAGSELDVELHQDESRAITAKAFVPLLDEDFETTFRSEGYGQDVGKMAERFEDCKKTLEKCSELQRAKPLPEVAEMLATLDRLGVVAGLEADVARAKAGEPEAIYRSHKRILELAGALAALARKQQRARIERTIETLRGLVQDHERRDLEAIETELKQAKDEAASADGRHEDLDRLEESLSDLEWKVRGRPYFDVLLDLAALSGLYVNPEQHRLFNEAEAVRKRIEEKGGIRVASDADLREIQQSHETLMRAHTDLPERRQKVIEEMRKDGRSFEDLGSHIQKKS